MSTEEKIFDKLDELGKLYAKLDKSVEVLKMREQPSFPCRAYMGIIEKEAEKDRLEIRKDINKLGSKCDTKVNYNFIWFVLLPIILGSYAFGWGIFVILTGVK